jgi:ferredoxin
VKATISIDPSVCRSTGLCQAMDAELFEVTGNSRAVARRPVLTDPDRVDLAEAIAECCPTGAITVRADDGSPPAAEAGPEEETAPGRDSHSAPPSRPVPG